MKLQEIRSIDGTLLSFDLPPPLKALNNATMKNIIDHPLKHILPTRQLAEWEKIRQWMKPLQGLQGICLPPDIKQLQNAVDTLSRYFPNSHLTINLDDLVDAPSEDVLNELLNEQETTVINELFQRKEPDQIGLLDKVSIKKILSYLYFFLQFYIDLQFYLEGFGIDISPKYIYENFTSPRTAIEQVLSICDKYPTNGRSYGARAVKAKSGLKLRKYDHQKSEILAKLPDGKFLCVLKEPRDSAQWLLVATELDNGEVIKGYVARKFTHQLN